MKKNDFLQALQNRNVRDYTYAIMFFVVSSFFAFFVIRPVLKIAISIQRESVDLKGINDVYEKNITKVLELQSSIESLRPKKFLLDEAIPSQPRIDQVIADIQEAARVSGVKLTSVTINPIDLKPAIKTLDTPENNSVQASISLSASFAQIEAFMRAIAQQRRIKGIHNMTLNINRGSEKSVELSLEVELESYYVAHQSNQL